MTTIDLSRWPAQRIEMRSRASLRAYDRNSRTHSDEQVAQIAASIREWGWTMPVLVTPDGDVIAGHGRLMAAEMLEIDEVPCMVAANWTEAQRRAYVLADNQLALNAGWDDKVRAAEMAFLSSVDFDVDLIGFSDEVLAGMLAADGDGLTDPDDTPAVPDQPVSRAGDLWVLGRHRIICGSSTEAATVKRVLGGVVPNLMVTDPPYGVEYDASWRERAGFNSKNAAHGKVLNDDRADWREAWALFPGQVAYIWHGALHNLAVAESLKAAKFDVRAQIVWVKTRAPISRGHYHWQHEPAFYAERVDSLGDEGSWSVEQNALAYVVRTGSSANWRGGRKQTTVWFIEHIKSDTGHSTQKPVECMKRPIENNSSPGQAVYEPFSGSGTTIIAAEMTGRCCHAIELNPAYVDVAVKRWQDFTGQTAVLDGDGRAFAEVAAERVGEARAA